MLGVDAAVGYCCCVHLGICVPLQDTIGRCLAACACAPAVRAWELGHWRRNKVSLLGVIAVCAWLLAAILLLLHVLGRSGA